MNHTRAWRNFRRMQASGLAFALLVYAGALTRAWGQLPPGPLLFQVLVLFPAVYALAVLVLALMVAPLKSRLKRYVWLSFIAGFGQSASSVLSGLAVLLVAAAFVYFDIESGTRLARYPAGAFSALGAGIGVLAAQLVLTLGLQKDPEAKPMIEEG